jgi:hypothetical protein
LPNGAAEVEINLLNQAILEGAAVGGDVFLNVFAEGALGHQVSAKVSDPIAATPALAVSIALPEVPETGVAWAGGSYPFTAAFIDTLLASNGLYHLTIIDSSATLGVWNIYVMGSAVAANTVGLPSMLDTPGGLIPSVPLSTDPSVFWSAYTAAYEMPVGFSEIGFFFDVVRRDRTSWAKSAIVAPVASF